LYSKGNHEFLGEYTHFILKIKSLFGLCLENAISMPKKRKRDGTDKDELTIVKGIWK